MKKLLNTGIFNGLHILVFFLVGFIASLATQILLYKTSGIIYKSELYNAPMIWGGALFFITIFLSERKSIKAKTIAWVSYRICCLILGIVTASFLLLVATEN